jgi:hypothetical protein
MKRNLVGKRLSFGESSPRNIARIACAYSRISATGFSIFEPYQFSTVTRCETPSPSTMRPCESSSMVAAAWAVATGVREWMGRTPVPSLMRLVRVA